MPLGRAGQASLAQAQPDPPHPDPRPVPAEAPESEVASRKVLVADDNPTNQEVALALLEILGVQGEAAFDGQEAVAMVEQGDYRMVLMDMQMPRVDGLAATRMIRALPAMTANAMESDRLLCLEGGMDDYLPKPIDRRRLKAMLERWDDPDRGSA